MVGKDARHRLQEAGKDWGLVETAPRRVERRPRRRPPLRSYIPFVVFVAVCLSIIGGVLWLVVGLAQSLTNSNHTAARHPSVSKTTGHLVVTRSSGTGHARHEAASAATLTPSPGGATATSVRSLLGGEATGMEISPGGPLPTSTPAPTATPIGDAGLVVAREVDLTGKPLQASTRFVSPSLRFYAVVTLHNVHSADQLHFIFQKDGVNLPGDDIQYQAGTTADVQSFSAWADYQGGTHSFPKGTYRVLFYRNGLLEVTRKFSVG